ncbi:MAG TPA: DUF1641 domain-containing protein [Jiangellales bacterium]|nr:DUF1641 domain-containing protein [Jiangellales bacterium]
MSTSTQAAAQSGPDPQNLTVEDKLDRLTAQVDAIADELRRQREERERWTELTHDLAPVARDAFAAVSDELEALSADVTVEDLARLGRTLARNVSTLESLLAQLEGLAALGTDATHLAGPALEALTTRLQDLEDKGYFVFARGGMDIADRVVTSFSEEDVRALGDNVVLILQTVKQMTQPEIMTMLRRTMVTVQEGEDHPVAPPSVLGLLRDMRDPQTRRGLARLLAMLHTLGEAPPGSTAYPSTTTPKEGR